ncbi:unnamed protein product [Wickerhamomyces anomalus]
MPINIATKNQQCMSRSPRTTPIDLTQLNSLHLPIPSFYETNVQDESSSSNSSTEQNVNQHVNRNFSSQQVTPNHETTQQKTNPLSVNNGGRVNNFSEIPSRLPVNIPPTAVFAPPSSRSKGKQQQNQTDDSNGSNFFKDLTPMVIKPGSRKRRNEPKTPTVSSSQPEPKKQKFSTETNIDEDVIEAKETDYTDLSQQAAVLNEFFGFDLQEPYEKNIIDNLTHLKHLLEQQTEQNRDLSEEIQRFLDGEDEHIPEEANVVIKEAEGASSLLINQEALERLDESIVEAPQPSIVNDNPFQEGLYQEPIVEPQCVNPLLVNRNPLVSQHYNFVFNPDPELDDGLSGLFNQDDRSFGSQESFEQNEGILGDNTFFDTFFDYEAAVEAPVQVEEPRVNEVQVEAINENNDDEPEIEESRPPYTEEQMDQLFAELFEGTDSGMVQNHRDDDGSNGQNQPHFEVELPCPSYVAANDDDDEEDLNTELCDGEGNEDSDEEDRHVYGGKTIPGFARKSPFNYTTSHNNEEINDEFELDIEDHDEIDKLEAELLVIVNDAEDEDDDDDDEEEEAYELESAISEEL